MNVTINITSDELEKMQEYAISSGVTVCDMLNQFVSDLTWSDRSAGTDEHDLAVAWMDRHYWIGKYTGSFVRYVINYEMLSPRTIATYKDDFEEAYNKYLKYCEKKGIVPDAIDKAIKDCKKYDRYMMK